MASSHPQHEKKPRRNIVWSSVILVMLLLGAFEFQKHFQTVTVSGNSMFPTFQSGQRLLATNAYNLVGPPKPNDVVVFKLPDTGELLIKRIYKVAGQRVDWDNVPNNYRIEQGPYIVPAGYIYVLGDNRGESEDSRMYGPIEKTAIVGKVVTIN